MPERKPPGAHLSADFWAHMMNRPAPGERTLSRPVPKGEELTGLVRVQQFLGSDPGSPDIDYAPTSSINPADPRTSRIKYWHNERVMEIEWGDGGRPTYYFDVSPSEAKSILPPRKSPGRYVNRVLNSHTYGYNE